QNQIGRLLDNDSTVLITGESGTGKEVIARTIHDNSDRNERSFVAVDCGSITESLIESELFGHIKGAFTDARQTRKGLFQEADGGTIFLDEITNTSPAFQAKLLRVLQEGEIRPVGSSTPISIDVRVLVATNQNLETMIEEGSFRTDLYYRLNVMQIDIPPLRERMGDLPYLTEHFIRKYSKKWGKQIKGISGDVLRCFKQYGWPGNIRELESAIASAVITASGETIQMSDLSTSILKPRHGNGGLAGLANGAGSSASESYEQSTSLALYNDLIDRRATFWDLVHRPYTKHEITKGVVKRLMELALREADGVYIKVAKKLGLASEDEQKRFLNFINRSGCKVDPTPFKKAARSKKKD
ncbi:sigma-54 interaction domain-containing protein, partial [Acidobacteriota bacterium]